MSVIILHTFEFVFWSFIHYICIFTTKLPDSQKKYLLIFLSNGEFIANSLYLGYLQVKFNFQYQNEVFLNK